MTNQSHIQTDALTIDTVHVTGDVHVVKLSDVFLQHGRGLEWATSSIVAGWALTLWLPGETLESSASFTGFARAGLDDATLVLPLTLVALLTMIGLIINGAWRRSPMLRMMGALCRCFIFGSLSIMFMIPYLTGEQEALSTGPAIYMILAGFDILAAYRTGADVRFYQRHR